MVRADPGYVAGVKLMERSWVPVLADLEGTIVARRSSALRAGLVRGELVAPNVRVAETAVRRSSQHS